MKPYFFLLTLAGLTSSLIGCSTSEDETCESIKMISGEGSPTTTFFFIDKSVSVGNDAYAVSKFTDRIKLTLNKQVSKVGDRVIIYQVHHNTLTSEISDDTCGSVPIPDNVCDLAEKKVKFLAAQQQEYVDEKATAIRKKALATLNNKGLAETNKQTDLWSTMQIIKDKDASGAPAVAYYFSDMVESMPGRNRRDLHTNPPKDRDQAIAFAKQDIERLAGTCGVKPRSFKNISVTVVSPHKPGTSIKLANPYIQTYWQELFNGFGIGSVTFI